MGFGHRVYKNYDPRARIIQQHMDEVFEATEYNPLVEIARELEKRALDDDYFTSRKLYPNVDFYSGIIYEALEIPTDMFTVIFAIPRTAGWVAQWMEMKDDPEQKIARPRQIYTGERERDYVADRRARGPGEDRRAARARGRNARAAAPEPSPRWQAHRPATAPTVEREAFEDLDEAVAAMRERALAIRARGAGCEPVAGCKDFEPRRPGPRAAAALERRAAAQAGAGVDVRGNGEFVPYRGGVRREELDPSGHETPFDAVRETLAGRTDDAERRRDRDPQGQLRRRAAGEAARRRRAALRRLRQRRRAERGRRLRGARRRDRLHPPDRQGEGRRRPLAGDVPGALRHLPQERDDRPPVPARRQDRAGLGPARERGADDAGRLPPPRRSQRVGQRQALHGRRRLERAAPARAPPRLGLPHRASASTSAGTRPTPTTSSWSTSTTPTATSSARASRPSSRPAAPRECPPARSSAW